MPPRTARPPAGGSGISTHVLDVSLGRPAAGVRVTLEREAGGVFRRVGAGRTDADGRLRTLLPPSRPPAPGVYRLTFETGPYFGRLGARSFHPRVAVIFRVERPEHHHVPLLVSPFGFTTYRGS